MWILAEELQNDQRTRIDVLCSMETWKSSLRKGIQLLQGTWGEVLGLFHGEWGWELDGITWMNRNDGIPGVKIPQNSILSLGVFSFCDFIWDCK